MTEANRIRKLSADVSPLRYASRAGRHLRVKLGGLTPAGRANFFVALDVTRADIDVTRAALCAEAGVSQPHYYTLVAAAGAGVSARYLTSLVRALRTLQSGAERGLPADTTLPVLQAAWRGCLSAACTRYGLDTDAAAAQLARPGEFPADANWRAASRARALAMYLASTELGLRGAQIAHITSVTPAAVHYQLAKCEDARDDAAFDAAVEAAAATIGGAP